MKIGHVTHIYLPHIGGIENYIYRLKSLHESQGHRVTIYTTTLSLRDGGSLSEEAVYCKTNFSIFRNPVSLELAQRLSAGNEDIYHLHSPWFLTSLIASRILKGKPKVMTVHSAQIGNKNLLIRILNLLYHNFAQYTLSNMDMLMPQGKRERQRLINGFNLCADDIVPIPNGIEIAKFRRKRGLESQFIKKYNLRPNSFKILFVSRLIPEKNPDKLIEAITKYIKNDDIDVILIGGGNEEYISNLRAISDKRIHILGMVSQEELVAAYFCANLFVFLGLWEGMPTVILEAMACGLPIVTTPVSGIPDMVTEGENGFFVNIPIDEKELADKIRYFTEEVDIKKMGKVNASKVSQNYTWDIIGKKTMDIYKQVLNRRSNDEHE